MRLVFLKVRNVHALYISVGWYWGVDETETTRGVDDSTESTRGARATSHRRRSCDWYVSVGVCQRLLRVNAQSLNAYQNVSKLDQAYIRWTLFSENPGPLYCHCLGEESIKTHIARTILSAYLTNDELRPILLNVVKRINLKLFLTTCI